MPSPANPAPAARDATWLVVALVLASSLVHAWVPGVLDYDRSAIGDGQWWRLVSAHLVHLNTAHLAMNLLALTLVIALLRTACAAATWFVAYAAMSLAVSAALLAFEPGLARYAGASGVIHGLLGFGALLRLPAARVESTILLTGLFAKLAWEAGSGPLAGSEALIGAPVITASHRYGAIAGIVLALVVGALRRGRGRFSAPRQL